MASVITVGYWSGYLSGLLAGSAIGWIASTLWFGTKASRVTEYNEDIEYNEDLPRSEWTCNTGCSCNPPEYSPILEKDSPEVPAVSSPSNSGDNVFYFRLTDKSLAGILENMRRDRQANDDGEFSFIPSPDNETEVDLDGAPASEAAPAKKNNENTEFIRSEEVDEMTGIFEEHSKVQGRSVEETLNVGRNLPKRPVAYPTSAGGGYATMTQIEDMGKKNAEFQEKTISRAEELEIIHAFRGIVNQSYYNVKESVSAQGYTLHPLYITNKDGDQKNPAPFYSGNTLGVRIADEDYNGVPSVGAVITEIVDVGGMDYKNRGAKK